MEKEALLARTLPRPGPQCRPGVPGTPSPTVGRVDQAQRSRLPFLLNPNGERRDSFMWLLDWYGYRLTGITDHFGVHTATVSRRLK